MLVHRRRIMPCFPIALSVLCAWAGAHPAGASAPATGAADRMLPPPPAASAPSPGPSSRFATPTATATTLLTAINNNDFPTVRLCLDIAPGHADEVEALLHTMDASAQLQQAATAKYAAAGTKAFGTPTPAMLADQLKIVAAAPVDITGATATLTLPATPNAQMSGGTIDLKKIGGEWKINAATFFKLAAEPSEKTAARIALSRKITDISLIMAHEITTGKYFSANDAYQEYWTRCKEAAQTPSTAPASATRPASAPATQH